MDSYTPRKDYSKTMKAAILTFIHLLICSPLSTKDSEVVSYAKSCKIEEPTFTVFPIIVIG